MSIGVLGELSWTWLGTKGRCEMWVLKAETESINSSMFTAAVARLARRRVNPSVGS